MNKVVWAVVFTFLIISGSQAGGFKSQVITLNAHPSHLVTWGDLQDTTKPPIILLSGPIDTWHSDSAWWAANGRLLSEHFRVFALDRAGIATENTNAPVGYLPLASDVYQLIKGFNLENPVVLAFASSNITLMSYLDEYQDKAPLKAVVMIDPDVLTPFSIARYKQDAEPFKQNLEKYLAYIGEGKYVSRVEQKNQQDRAVLEALTDKVNVEWPLVEKMFKHRLSIVNQQNQFREIAGYGAELEAVAEHAWTESIPLLVIDTQFEQKYIENTEDEEAIKGLQAWQQDAKRYYQSLVKQSRKGEYVEVKSKAHLYQVAHAEELVKKVKAFSSLNVSQ